MKKSLISYIVGITCHDTLAKIHVDLSNDIWPAAIPIQYKPYWFDHCVLSYSGTRLQIIRDHIETIVDYEKIKWWQNLHMKYQRKEEPKKKIKLPSLSSFKK